VGFGVVRALQPGDPRLIGPYRLVGQLGAGGMGRVFLGMSAGGRPVAVKIIRAELAADPEFRTRFRREVTAARRVNGLFTALVVDADVDAVVPWLATAFVPAPSLAETVNESGPLSPRAVLSLAAGLAEGLVAIHSVGVVHGDLKPSNVLLAEDGPRVIDFGISQAAGAAPVTPTGLVVGSPGFMSPEQALGRKVGPLSDVFSLGAVLAFAATGERPFGSGSPVELLDRVVHGSPRLDAVPAEVRSLCRRCLARDPDQRPSAASLLAEMGDVQFATGWLPESIIRMIPMEIPSSDDDQISIVNVGGEWTVTLGSVEQGVPDQAEPGRAGRPAQEVPSGDQSQPGSPPAPQEPPRRGSGPQAAMARPQPDQAPETGGSRWSNYRLRLPGQPATADQQPRSSGQVHTSDPRHSPERRQVPDWWQPAGRPQPAASHPQTADHPQESDPAQLADDPLQGDYSQDAEPPQLADQPPEDDGYAPRSTWYRPLVAVCVVALLAVAVAVGYRLTLLTWHPGDPPDGATPSSASALPGPFTTGPLRITNAYTYQQGAIIYVRLYYANPGDASGFGFAGANGSSLAQQTYQFASPGAAIVEPNSITYPFDQGCGTSKPSATYVKAWLTSANSRTKSVVIHLVCASSGATPQA
jgi:serine/threonine protein kinase